MASKLKDLRNLILICEERKVLTIQYANTKEIFSKSNGRKYDKRVGKSLRDEKQQFHEVKKIKDLD